MTINKQEALAQLKKLEAEMNQLKAVIEAPEKAKSLLTKPVAGSGSEYWVLADGGYNEFAPAKRHAVNAPDYSCYTHGNNFDNKQQVDDYAKAINTFLLLRHCEGSEAPREETPQHFITQNDLGDIIAPYSILPANKSSLLSPMFKTWESALDAINKVGKENIKHMFKTFHGLT